jgi:hypothetical protein
VTTAICIGGHLLEGSQPDAFWQEACLSFFGAVEEPIGRAANARGTIVPWTPRIRDNMFRRAAWECYAGGEEQANVAERLRWAAAFHIDFARRMLFMGVDASKGSATDALLKFFEGRLLPRQVALRYGYLFERDHMRGPQSYVVGVRESSRWADYRQTDDLLKWWGNRLALHQDGEGVRDVFKNNYFLADNTRLLAGIEPVAADFGRIEHCGQYVVWRLENGDCELARERLIASGMIAPARWA